MPCAVRRRGQKPRREPLGPKDGDSSLARSSVKREQKTVGTGMQRVLPVSVRRSALHGSGPVGSRRAARPGFSWVPHGILLGVSIGPRRGGDPQTKNPLRPDRRERVEKLVVRRRARPLPPCKEAGQAVDRDRGWHSSNESSFCLSTGASRSSQEAKTDGLFKCWRSPP